MLKRIMKNLVVSFFGNFEICCYCYIGGNFCGIRFFVKRVFVMYVKVWVGRLVG